MKQEITYSEQRKTDNKKKLDVTHAQGITLQKGHISICL